MYLTLVLQSRKYPEVITKLNTGCQTGPWEQLPTSSPYPPLEALQQKRLAARRHKTTYCYDFPSVFSNALRQAWLARAIAGEPGDAPRGS